VENKSNDKLFWGTLLINFSSQLVFSIIIFIVFAFSFGSSNVNISMVVFSLLWFILLVVVNKGCFNSIKNAERKATAFLKWLFALLLGSCPLYDFYLGYFGYPGVLELVYSTPPVLQLSGLILIMYLCSNFIIRS